MDFSMLEDPRLSSELSSPLTAEKFRQQLSGKNASLQFKGLQPGHCTHFCIVMVPRNSVNNVQTDSGDHSDETIIKTV